MTQEGHALLIIDVQNDFCPGGALAVPGGDEVVPVINRVIRMFIDHGRPIFASRDWHPVMTRHFQGYGGVWPPHCIQGTKGAEFHPGLELPEGTVVISKGMDPEKDAYSAFDGVSKDGEGLLTLIKRMGIRVLWVCGLATDYCVKNTVLDALSHGIGVILIPEGMRSVDLHPGDGERAIQEMVSRGAKILSSSGSLVKTG